MGADPVTAIANAAGSFMDFAKTGIGGVFNLIQGREDAYREKNQTRLERDKLEYGENSQRLSFLMSSQTDASKTFTIIAIVMTLIVIALAYFKKMKQ